MQRQELLDSLIALTGDLRPVAQSSAAELTDLRRAFIRKLQSQAAPRSGTATARAAGRVDASLLNDLDYLVAGGLAATAAGPAVDVPSSAPVLFSHSEAQRRNPYWYP